MKTSRERQQRMLEQLDHDIKFWTTFKNRNEGTKKYLAKLRYERRKWRNMEVFDIA